MSYTDYIKQAQDLVTSRKETRAGFIALALEKNYLAQPYVEEAKALRSLAGKVKTAKELLKIKELYPSLLSASALSIKSLNYLTDRDKQIAIEGSIDEFLEPVGNEFPNELVYRYLLTKGDALGGQARNLAGVLGEKKFLRAFLSVLNVYQKLFYWMDKDTYLWYRRALEDS